MTDRIIYMNTIDDITNYCNTAITKLNGNLGGSVDSISVLNSIMTSITLPFSVLEERYYVDRYFRDTYYSYFSSKHFSYGKRCKRISFFNGIIRSSWFSNASMHARLQDRYIGHTVIRPTMTGSVGRTLIDPRKMQINDRYIRKAKYRSTIRSVKLEVEAFPYSMQDGEAMTCSETALTMLLDYFGTCFSDYRVYMPTEITEIANKYSYERSLPSHGMQLTVISKVLMEAGLYPRVYIKNIITDDEFRRVLHYYIESGIPVVAAHGTSPDDMTHTSLCIGHGKPTRTPTAIDLNAQTASEYGSLYVIDSADYYDKYVVIDDNLAPYQLMSFPNLSVNTNISTQVVIVPLDRRMFFEAIDARAIALKWLSSNVYGIQRILHQMSASDSQILQPLIYRIFLASSRNYKIHKNINYQSRLVRAIYADLPMPRFVWVCELYTNVGYNSLLSIGEIVLDCTSWANTDNGYGVILFNYPHLVSYRYPNEPQSVLGKRLISKLKLSDSWKESKGYTHNLIPCCSTRE